MTTPRWGELDLLLKWLGKKFGQPRGISPAAAHEKKAEKNKQNKGKD